MEYVLATLDVPGQERIYYAGPDRKIGGRMAHKVTHGDRKQPDSSGRSLMRLPSTVLSHIFMTVPPPCDFLLLTQGALAGSASTLRANTHKSSDLS
jgi:hypothetical protein